MDPQARRNLNNVIGVVLCVILALLVGLLYWWIRSPGGVIPGE